MWERLFCFKHSGKCPGFTLRYCRVTATTLLHLQLANSKTDFSWGVCNNGTSGWFSYSYRQPSCESNAHDISGTAALWAWALLFPQILGFWSPKWQRKLHLWEEMFSLIYYHKRWYASPLDGKPHFWKSGTSHEKTMTVQKKGTLNAIIQNVLMCEIW